MAFPIILSSPSGGGKTTIAQKLLAARQDVGYSVSCTTRPPREGEVEGRDYHFLSAEDFKRGQKAGEFAESAEVHGHLYGTLRAEVERVLVVGQARDHGHRRPGLPSVRGCISRVGADFHSAAFSRGPDRQAGGDGARKSQNR